MMVTPRKLVISRAFPCGLRANCPAFFLRTPTGGVGVPKAGNALDKGLISSRWSIIVYGPAFEPMKGVDARVPVPRRVR